MHMRISFNWSLSVLPPYVFRNNQTSATFYFLFRIIFFSHQLVFPFYQDLLARHFFEGRYDKNKAVCNLGIAK